ncbi:response regulator [Bradyrhizobium genosp. L]|uniref:hybrid sensor histidine kinase/response regulator n=1 Tax=Bradyrhizobium genosp. L TaxID=83637 RepID=UPI0018A28CA6|nr:PAS domain-containing sensor histidine kinase [Bradyrhizobium genosp. L]QPF83799.1 response regulator [Bradyrhizobium genosp. L]
MAERATHDTDYGSLTDEELISRLREAEETLDAIRTGAVDAVVIAGSQGQQVYTLENADRPYRVLVEQMQEGAITLSETGIILYCNARFATLVAGPHDGIVGQPFVRYFRADEAESLSSMIATGAGSGVSGEFAIVNEFGQEVPVNISLVDLKVDNAMPRLVCGIVTDLTFSHMRARELSAANEKLAGEIDERRKTEENLQLTLDAAEMGIWELDLFDGRLSRSPQHDRLFGDTGLLSFDLPALVSRFVPEDQTKVHEAFERARETGNVQFERRIRRANDNAVRWVSVKGRTFYDGEHPIRITGVTADVTQRREVDEQLRQAQKMDAVGQLTGGVAHDFNNLLMIIGGSLDMLRRRLPDDAKLVRLFETARQAVARGSKLNHQLLAFSRRQDLQMEVVQINDLIPTFEHLLERAVGEIVKIKFIKDLNLWECRTDPHQLETAIVNLAINARDAMPHGGELVIKTANRRVNEALASRWEASAGEYAMISVQDTGIGMSAEVLAHVFEPFFTTKDVGKGTGLGLSQVYGFAKQSGGFVAVASMPGQGTLIEVFLKRSNDPVQTVRKPTETKLEAGTGLVLVVEDDADVRVTTSGMLEDLGYSVLSAATGSAALEIVQGTASLNLVFTDVVMPDGMSGVELTRRIGLLRPELPVLLTSGYTAQRAIPEMPTGEQALLKKPFSQAELSVAIRKIMANARNT